MTRVIPPPWVLKRKTSQSIKMVHASRPCPKRNTPGVRPLVGEKKERISEWSQPKKRRSPVYRTYEDRLISCGESLSLWTQEVEDGEVVGEVFERSFPGSLADLNEVSDEWSGVRRTEDGCWEVYGSLPPHLYGVDDTFRWAIERRARAREPGLRERQRTRWQSWQRHKQR